MNTRDYPSLYLDTNYSKDVSLLLHCCSTFHGHSRVFNNEHNTYPKMSVK